jgi:hypothetical protein
MKRPSPIRHLRVALLALALSVGASGAVGVSASSATTIQWHAGPYAQTIQNGLAWATGPAHTLTNNNAQVYANLCVGAIDVYGGTLSGAGVCGDFAYAVMVAHGYCGCVLRDPAVYPYTGQGFLWYAEESY